MDTPADVTVTCDLCSRPVCAYRVTFAGVSTVEVAIPESAAGGSLTHRSRPDGAGPPGAFLIEANDPGQEITHRHKLACISRRHPRGHPRYERVITWERAERAVRAAVAAGRSSIRMSEI